MRSIEATMRELLATTQAASKAKLDAGRVDTVFKVGYCVLLWTKELLDAADIGKLRPRWDGPFTVAACTRPQRLHACIATQDALQPDGQRRPAQALFQVERSDQPPPPGPVSDAGQAGEHEVDLLLNRRVVPVRGVTEYLQVVRWRGHASLADAWPAAPGWRRWTIAAIWRRSTMPSRPTAARPGALPLAGTFFGGRGRFRGRDPGPLLHGGCWCAAAPAARSVPVLVPPVGWRVAGTGEPEVLSGPALVTVGRPVLFHWPASDEGSVAVT